MQPGPPNDNPRPALWKLGILALCISFAAAVTALISDAPQHVTSGLSAIAVIALVLGVAAIRQLFSYQHALQYHIHGQAAAQTKARDLLDAELKIRHRMAAQLEQSEERLEMMITGANDGFWDRPDMSRQTLWWSPRLYTLLGLSPQSFPASYRGFFGLCHLHDRPRLKQALRAALRGGQDPDLELRVQVKDKGYRWFRLRGRVFLDSDKRPHRMAGSFKDIHREKEASAELVQKNMQLAALNRHLRANRAQLVHAEKMSSLGQLAAGVAHEINNPVGFIRSNLGTMSEYITAFSAALTPLLENPGAEIPAQTRQILQDEDYAFVLADSADLLRESLAGTERITEIVRSLKSFARPDEQTMAPAQINDGLETALKMVWNALKYRCVVKKEFGDIPPVTCNLSRLNQVFMNLMVNAAHAIEEKGEITLRTTHRAGEIIVEVSDTGRGIPQNKQKQIFEPFFTTKPVGEGTGLGLSISHGIIEEHQGTIEVHSIEGVGTTFTVRIPDNLPSLNAGLPDGTTVTA